MAALRIYEVRSICEYLDIINGAEPNTRQTAKNRLVETYKHLGIGVNKLCFDQNVVVQL